MMDVNKTDEGEQTRSVGGWQEDASPSTIRNYHLTPEMTPLSQSVLRHKRKSLLPASSVDLSADQDLKTHE